MKEARVLYWFRTDLRLHDSPALQVALDLKPAVLYPIFTFDPHYVYHSKGSGNRWQFLLDCQIDLSASITKLNPKSKLFVLREAPQTLLPKLFTAWRITHLVFERDTDAYARERDRVVSALARDAGVETVTRSGRTLWDSDAVVVQHGGKPTIRCRIRVKPPIDFEQELPDADPNLNASVREGEFKPYKTGIAGPHGDFRPEVLEELGFAPATTPHRGGETRALKMLDHIIADEEYAAKFQKPKTSPAAFEPQSTTLLSPHHHFGSLSLAYLVSRYKGASAPPESLTGQLLFRDMYFAAQAAVEHGTETGTNAISGEYHVDSPQAERWFQRWKHGVTGFPWIDALMRQLKHDGWIHHLGRHSVACFLTRGGCYVHWERGADVFEEWLIDHEPACNAGNWQWFSCTAFFSQYFRCYSPIAFGQKWDKEGHFVRRWVPELKGLDAKYIYEPWKAPLSALDKAGVRIEGDGGLGAGGDGKAKREEGTYPEPMFDFNERRKVCLDAMKTAYQVGINGDDERVQNGTWRELFEAAGPGEMQEEDHAFSDADPEHADDSEHASHKRKVQVKKEGPMDRHFKKIKKEEEVQGAKVQWPIINQSDPDLLTIAELGQSSKEHFR
ncbi:DNA photolyase [Apiospora aurea]|uniref:DNA photolyase n=1 Tax=Apiospora aurea TaxID=335848 RepID=A0ABR1PSG7_9PEZI